MRELLEVIRRKPGADGTTVTLADGNVWLFANPRYQASAEGLTEPLIDSALDQIFESSILNQKIPVALFFEVARKLLLANYDLSEMETSRLLSHSSGDESQVFAEKVLCAIFGSDRSDKTYTSWVRASLIANGLDHAMIPAQDLINVLSILIATHRTIPLSCFADACRLADTKARLETLI